ncbi:hypothetical protein C8Q76DRAFT_759373 [Earliella scabrosa]|nr:hypothetical protein C8Q76DRAFT_759373 [Earliella scabrosa]
MLEMVSPRRTRRLALLSTFIVLIFVSLGVMWIHDIDTPWTTFHYLHPPPHHHRVTHERPFCDTPSPPGHPPAEYFNINHQQAFCEDRFGAAYLENLSQNVVEYCNETATSRLSCFHSRTAADNRVDSFCMIESALYDSRSSQFRLDCPIRPDVDAKYPRVGSLSKYWYGTGVQNVLSRMVNIHKSNEAINKTDQPPQFSVLVQREGAGNAWHCMMELFSFYLTFDVLRMTLNPATNAPFFRAADIANTQVVILDSHPDGPYFDLWGLFSDKPVRRLKELDLAATGPQNVIIPLAGGGNPFWQNDWETNACQYSILLDTFVDRVLDQTMHLNLAEDAARADGTIIITVIDRRETRRLQNMDRLIKRLRAELPLPPPPSTPSEPQSSTGSASPTSAHINVVDFARMSFHDQVRLAHASDVLVGVHGAGLTHLFWQRRGSAVVEILPHDVNNVGFRTASQMRGLHYFRAHGEEPTPEEKAKASDWHVRDVAIGEDRFVEVVTAAVKSVYNTGLRSWDVARR